MRIARNDRCRSSFPGFSRPISDSVVSRRERERTWRFLTTKLRLKVNETKSADLYARFRRPQPSHHHAAQRLGLGCDPFIRLELSDVAPHALRHCDRLSDR
jgi:hypothetical protein